MKYAIIIPARYDSKRLPGKPLLLIKGVPMLIRTYNQCKKVKEKIKIYVATDSLKIKDECMKHNIPVIMTSKKCLTGTDRVAEASNKIKEKYIVNVQGDEPLINPEDISAVIREHKNNKKLVVNGYAQIRNINLFKSINIPKVVFDKRNMLLYMSRSSIPANKKRTMKNAYRQICIYCYSKNELKKFASYKKKSPLEKIEDIEILRFLEIGSQVKMLRLSNRSISVDIKADIKKVEKRL